jgi:hypothetical protein
VHQQPAKLNWQIISGAPLLFNGPVAFFAFYGQQGMRVLSAFSPSFSLAGRICRRCANSLSKTPAVSQSTFII